MLCQTAKIEERGRPRPQKAKVAEQADRGVSRLKGPKAIPALTPSAGLIMLRTRPSVLGFGVPASAGETFAILSVLTLFRPACLRAARRLKAGLHT